MKYIPIVLVLLAFIAAHRFAAKIAKAKPSDFEAIEAFVKARALRVISIEQRYNQWPYWLRGHLRLSNIARIFVVTAESHLGVGRREFHVAFDDNWGASHDLQLLREIVVAP